MKRKIVKLGTSTLVTSLPSVWTKRLSLKAGDEVEVQEQGNHLTISPEPAQHTEKTVLDLAKLNFLLRHLLTAEYKKGYDEIEVRFDTHQKAKIIQDKANELIGVTIMNQGKGFCLIKDLGGSQQDFEVILKRIFLLLTTMAGESLKVLEKGESGLEYIADLEENINKFTDYALRLINKYHHMPSLYCLVESLENVGDEYKRFLQFLAEYKVFSKEHLNIYRNLLNWFNSFQEMYFNFSNQKAVTLAKEHDSILEKIAQLRKSCKSAKEMEVLRYLDNILECMIRTFNHALLQRLN